MRITDEEARRKAHEVLDLCFDITEAGRDAFFTYNPHINQVDADVYEGEWPCKYKRHDGYLHNNYGTDVDQLIEALKEIKNDA